MTVSVGLDTSTRDTALANQSNSSSDSSTIGGDFEMFLKMLTVQLENQDPLDPMDTEQFTQQLATFSQLEQQMEMNEHLESIAAQSDFSAQALAVSYLDKQVLAPTEYDFEEADITLLEGEPGPYEFAYTLKNYSSDVNVEIRDSAGELIRQMDGGKNSGVNYMEWDFKNDDGDVIAPGDYTIQVYAKDSDGEKVAHRLYTYSRVDSVYGDASSPTLTLNNGDDISLDDVLKVKDDETVVVYQPNSSLDDSASDSADDSSDETSES